MLVSVGREKKCHEDLGFIIFEKLEQKECHDMLVSVGREKKCHADLGFIIFEKLEQKECHADLYFANAKYGEKKKTVIFVL